MIEILYAVGVMLVIGALLGLVLAIAAQYLNVKTDERTAMVTEMLPGVNCGGCGYPGCAGFAEALVSGEVKKVSECKVSKPDARQKIKDYMDVTPSPTGEITKVDI